VTDTLLSSATREVVIGFDRPFVVIGERINPVLARRSGIRPSEFPIAQTPEAAATAAGGSR
jgi:5-methyltetrahydrofolate--homocysteine methyltransferase